jgi:hypothetical protein
VSSLLVGLSRRAASKSRMANLRCERAHLGRPSASKVKTGFAIGETDYFGSAQSRQCVSSTLFLVPATLRRAWSHFVQRSNSHPWSEGTAAISTARCSNFSNACCYVAVDVVPTNTVVAAAATISANRAGVLVYVFRLLSCCCTASSSRMANLRREKARRA